MAILALIPFDPYSELEGLMRGRSDAGALASFIGYVRDSANSVSSLRLDHYPAFTQRVLDEIESDCKTRFDVFATLVIHRAGELEPGEPIVLVAAVSLHRKAALACVDYLMDRLKTEAPFWKQEIGPNTSQWIEPREEDHQARKNWDS